MKQDKKGGYRVIGHGGGGKGGGKQRTPVESPDSLHSVAYAKVLDLISEGEIFGPVHGAGEFLRDIYLDGTPIQNESGGLNFEQVQCDFRYGTQDQDYIQGFPSSEVTTPISIELTSSLAWVRAISNTELSAVRITMAVAGLSKTNTENGDINGYSVAYAIDLSTDGGAYETVLNTAFTGKTTQRYTRSHRVDLPDANTGWSIRVRRLTPNASSATIADRTYIDTLTDIIDAKMRYPMSAIVGIQINAAQFQSIPVRSYHMRGRLVRVPTNYDPETRIYTGAWDGLFKIAYTNNPAWVFYDLAGNDRYGLGERIPAGYVDKWSLYEIGRYCDELVPDGKGGTEPRFTCNCYLQQRGDAWKVMQDLASVFRGIIYYAGGTVVPSADIPRDPVYAFTNGNVIDGRFSYMGSGGRTRYTVALVSWNDMTANGVAKVEPVEDREGIARYGIRQTEMVAFGCTSQGQAQRVGRWALVTSMLETDTVTFNVGLDGAIAMPGQVIRVADVFRAGRRIGGRISAATIDSLTLDRPIENHSGQEISVVMPDGITQTRDVTEINGNVVTVNPNFSEVPSSESVWATDSDDLKTQLFRVVSVAEGTQENRITFQITAVKHVADKYAAIDFQTIIQLPPVTVVPPSVQPPPDNVTISEYSVISQGTTSQSMVIQWDKVDSAIYYDAQWRRDDGDWVTVPRTGTTNVEVQNIYAGGYLARVRSVNAAGVQSVWSTSILTELSGIIGAPPAVTFLQTKSIVFGIELTWGFPVGPSIIEKTEINYSLTNVFADSIRLGDFSFPQNTHTLMGLAAGATLYFWTRLIDKNGTNGPWYPIGLGVQGTSSNSAADILDYLNGQITSTQLSEELLEEIDSGGGAAVEVEQIKTDLAAMYTIKTQYTLDDRLYLAGIGVGVENNEGIIESQVLIAADRFAVIHPNDAGGVTTPFVIQGGDVFINSAFIQDATIGSAKLQNWLYSDSLDVNGNPIIGINFRTGVIQSGQTGYNNGNGFWLGNDGGTTKFSLGNSAGSNITWNGTRLNIEGELVATGNILNDAVTQTYFVVGGYGLTIPTKGRAGAVIQMDAIWAASRAGAQFASQAGTHRILINGIVVWQENIAWSFRQSSGSIVYDSLLTSINFQRSVTIRIPESIVGDAVISMDMISATSPAYAWASYGFSMTAIVLKK